MPSTDMPYERGDTADAGAPPTCRKRASLDPVTLIAGIVTLLVSGYVLSDGASWLPAFDLRWVLAGGAVVIGVLMLGASMRGGRE